VTAPVTLDAHHLGLGATGNETWSRGVAAALEDDGGPPWDYLVTKAGRRLLPSTVTTGRVHEVSASSARRLLLDLPRWVRTSSPAALVAQYTLPPVPVPGVVVVHDLSFEDPRAREWLSAVSLTRYRATIRWSARRARAVVVSSEWTRSDLLRHYDVDPDRVFVAPCAVSPVLAAALAAEPRVQPRTPIVLVVGTVLARKNLLMVARAVATLRQQGSPVVLRVVGPVPPAGEPVLAGLRQVLPEGLELWGSVPQDRLVTAYRSSTVLCFPSRFEGFGIPALEAMAAGLPVIASSATCLPEVVGSAGLLVDPDDDAGWVRAIESVLAGSRSDLVEAGLNRSASYSWTATAAVVREAVAFAIGAAAA
jgi:glycosyltransferase involved in cell wall biosynthesis